MAPHIERILTAANSAPSGENCQPWRFVVSGDTVDVYLRPERDKSAYNWGQRGSLMACGAALENLVLAAGQEGYHANVEFKLTENPIHVASVELSKGSQGDILAGAIMERVTNRRPYSREPLSLPQRDAILRAASAVVGPSVRLVGDREHVEILGRVGAMNEEVMLTNRAVHDFFFDHINWTKEDDDRETVGFFIDTLDLAPPARVVFRLLRNWKTAKILTTLGIHKLIGKENGRSNASASAIAIIGSEGTGPLDYVLAGRMLERIWLSATAQGLSLQPLTGILFFNLLVASGESSPFSIAQERVIRSGAEKIEHILKNGHRPLAMVRIGKAEGPPTARSSRFPLSVALS